MFIDLRSLPTPVRLTCDICVIGAGPAGLSLAREFHNSNLQICVLESGGLVLEPENQELVEADSVSLPYRHYDKRCRVFGGNTARWLGQCGPLDPLDFEARSWVDYSGWPVESSSLEPYIDRAHGLLQLTTNNYDAHFWGRDAAQVQAVNGPDVEHRIWQFSPPTDFGLVYRQEFEAARNIQILLHANATEIELDRYAAGVKAVRVATLDGKTGLVSAPIVILACGGIENARVLLYSNRIQGRGIGNGFDQVGRYFADHPHQVAGQVEFRPGVPRGWVGAYKERRAHGGRYRAGLGLSPEAQEREQILNCAIQFMDWYVDDGWLCTQPRGYRATKALAKLASRKTVWSHLRNDLLAGRMPYGLRPILLDLLTDPLGASSGVVNRMRGGSLIAYTQSEQAPNPSSRVKLSERRDRLGLPMAQIDWRLHAIDKLTIRRTVELASTELERLGLATIRPFEWLTADDTTWPHIRGGAYHHMGTTRMGSEPSSSVVDADCRVHGVHNLYVAGSSVFPTTGFVNPTLTLTALALRLADHVKMRLQYERQVALSAVAAE